MIRAKSTTKPGKPGFYIRYIRFPCCEYSGMTQSGMKKNLKNLKKNICVVDIKKYI